MTTLTQPAASVKPIRADVTPAPERDPWDSPEWDRWTWELGPQSAPVEPALSLTIHGTVYAVSVHPTDDPAVRRVYRLQKADGTLYDVADRCTEPTTCDCPDHVYRKAGTGAPCKHVAALVRLGLLPAISATPAPTPTPAPAPKPQPLPRRERHADDLGSVPPQQVEASAPVPARRNVPDAPDRVEAPLPTRPRSYVPTEEDWADYARWSQEREQAALREQIERDAAREEVLGVLIPGRNLWFDGCIPAAVAERIRGRSTLGPSREPLAWD